MKRHYIEFQDRSVALAYFISFRCNGTWLHGDERGSVDRRHFNTFGAPKIEPDSDRQSTKRRLMKSQSFLLSERQRKIVEQAIREVCRVPGCVLHALNARTNHVHLVVSNATSSERMMDAFKAYSTRALRKAVLIGADSKPCSRHRSTRYLWTEDHIATALDYVVNGQGDELPKFD